MLAIMERAFYRGKPVRGFFDYGVAGGPMLRATLYMVSIGNSGPMWVSVRSIRNNTIPENLPSPERYHFISLGDAARPPFPYVSPRHYHLLPESWEALRSLRLG